MGISGNYNNIQINFFYDISLGEDISLYIPKLSLKLGYNILSAANNFIKESSVSNRSEGSSLKERFNKRLL